MTIFSLKMTFFSSFSLILFFSFLACTALVISSSTSFTYSGIPIAPSKGFCKHSHARKVGKELVKRDPSKEGDDGEDILKLLLPKDKVGQIAVVPLHRVTFMESVCLNHRVFYNLENDDCAG